MWERSSSGWVLRLPGVDGVEILWCVQPSRSSVIVRVRKTGAQLACIEAARA
jgi:hypothetical protein